MQYPLELSIGHCLSCSCSCSRIGSELAKPPIGQPSTKSSPPPPTWSPRATSALILSAGADGPEGPAVVRASQPQPISPRGRRHWQLVDSHLGEDERTLLGQFRAGWRAGKSFDGAPSGARMRRQRELLWLRTLSPPTMVLARHPGTRTSSINELTHTEWRFTIADVRSSAQQPSSMDGLAVAEAEPEPEPAELNRKQTQTFVCLCVLHPAGAKLVRAGSRERKLLAHERWKQ